MSNDLRDSWSNIHSYEHEMQVILTYDDIYHELEHLPDTEVHTEHSISVRGIDGTTSSPLISIQVELTEEVLIDPPKSEEDSLNYIIWGSVAAAIILTIILVAAFIKNESEKEVTLPEDSDIKDVVEAEIIE